MTRASKAAQAMTGDGTVDDLSMLVRQLVHALRKASPDNALAERAMDYLKRKGLQGSPLRSIAAHSQAQAYEVLVGGKWLAVTQAQYDACIGKKRVGSPASPVASEREGLTDDELMDLACKHGVCCDPSALHFGHAVMAATRQPSVELTAAQREAIEFFGKLVWGNASRLDAGPHLDALRALFATRTGSDT